MWRWGIAAGIAVGIAAAMLLVTRIGERPAPGPPAQPEEPGKIRVSFEQPKPPRDAGRPSSSSSRAEDTVARQLDLLERGDLEGFRRTFLATVSITPDDFAACQRRVKQVPVRPDWEMAEESTDSGHRVRRVSMFGKSMTGFHEQNGTWLADALWCLPVGLP